MLEKWKFIKVDFFIKIEKEFLNKTTIRVSVQKEVNPDLKIIYKKAEEIEDPGDWIEKLRGNL